MAIQIKEPVSGGTHLAGALLGAVGAGILWRRSVGHGDWQQGLSVLIFGASLVMLYLSSAMYHLLGTSERARRVFRRIDHSMIFFLIAGTYTPFCLIALRGTLGWSLFAGIWALAFCGLITKMFWLEAPRRLSTALYLLMGWLAMGFIVPLSRAIGPTATGWLIAGGVAYSVGAVIYAVKKPDPFPGVFGFHEIWHLHVLAGSFFHYLSIATLVPG